MGSSLLELLLALPVPGCHMQWSLPACRLQGAGGGAGSAGAGGATGQAGRGQQSWQGRAHGSAYGGRRREAQGLASQPVHKYCTPAGVLPVGYSPRFVLLFVWLPLNGH